MRSGGACPARTPWSVADRASSSPILAHARPPVPIRRRSAVWAGLRSARLPTVRRTLAGLLFGVAYVCASLAIGGWLLQRTAFSPDRTSSVAKTVLEDQRIRAEVVDLIA